MENFILKEISVPEAQSIDLSDIPKGIDNYHIDLKLSSKFCDDLNSLIDSLIHEKASVNPGQVNQDEEKNTLRKNYLELMTILIHRVKTDLDPTEVYLLQFSVPKYILLTVRKKLDGFVGEQKTRSMDLRAHGSGRALAAHQHLSWLGKNYDSLYYIITKTIFDQLYHVEKRELVSIRAQYLERTANSTLDVIFNTLLMAKDIVRPRFLVTHFLIWNKKPELDNFGFLNKAIEAVALHDFNDLPISTLRENAQTSSQREIHDELSGFQNCNNFLGVCYDSKTKIFEEYSWLDEPSNIELIYDIEKLKELAGQLKSTEGFKTSWQYKKRISKSRSALKKISSILKKKRILDHYIASYKIKDLRQNQIALQVDPALLCQYLCDEFTLKQLQDRLIGDKGLTKEDIEILKQAQSEVLEDSRTESLNYTYKILYDLARFRKNLKQFRFAHRLFNRISLLVSREDLRLSKEAGTLYHLPMHHEVEEVEEKIIHHTILKADIRGSTTVTNELQSKGLNPASFFSTRFFGPINAVLEDYSAGKVFIEGDAIILSFLEYENNPQQCFSVSRACGLARTILKIIHTNNQYSQEMGLPLLELGIGICFSDEAPRYLFDEDKPIMISSAIGLADRMSSCAWKLRAALKPGSFNVAVLEMADGEKDNGEKGQYHMHFNVNGILLDESAFNKLQQEINFSQTSLTVGSQAIDFLYGTYPDNKGKQRGLVIRKGTVDLWENNNIIERPDSSDFYYEVVTNEKINSIIRSRST